MLTKGPQLCVCKGRIWKRIEDTDDMIFPDRIIGRSLQLGRRKEG